MKATTLSTDKIRDSKSVPILVVKENQLHCTEYCIEDMRSGVLAPLRSDYSVYTAEPNTDGDYEDIYDDGFSVIPELRNIASTAPNLSLKVFEGVANFECADVSDVLSEGVDVPLNFTPPFKEFFIEINRDMRQKFCIEAVHALAYEHNYEDAITHGKKAITIDGVAGFEYDQTYIERLVLHVSNHVYEKDDAEHAFDLRVYIDQVAGRDYSPGKLWDRTKHSGLTVYNGQIRVRISAKSGLPVLIEHKNGDDDKYRPLNTNDYSFQLAEQLYDYGIVTSLLHAKTPFDEAKPTRQQKRSAKRKGTPIPSEHYVLDVKGLGGSHSNQPSRKRGGSRGGQNREHLVRGHFRYYSEEKPLFGNISGAVWVPSHKRGSASKGRITKDYRLSAGKTSKND